MIVPHYMEIPKDREELKKLVEKPFLVVAESWEHADVALLDEDYYWYSPIDGSEMFPEPTHYMEIPKL